MRKAVLKWQCDVLKTLAFTMQGLTKTLGTDLLVGNVDSSEETLRESENISATAGSILSTVS